MIPHSDLLGTGYSCFLSLQALAHDFPSIFQSHGFRDVQPPAVTHSTEGTELNPRKRPRTEEEKQQWFQSGIVKPCRRAVAEWRCSQREPERLSTSVPAWDFILTLRLQRANFCGTKFLCVWNNCTFIIKTYVFYNKQPQLWGWGFFCLFFWGERGGMGATTPSFHTG